MSVICAIELIPDQSEETPGGFLGDSIFFKRLSQFDRFDSRNLACILESEGVFGFEIISATFQPCNNSWMNCFFLVFFCPSNHQIVLQRCSVVVSSPAQNWVNCCLLFGLCESPDRIRRAFASLVVIPEIPSESRCLKTMAE